MRESYYVTPIGKLPSSWKIKQLGDVVKEMKSGLSRKLSIQDIGTPVIRSNNIVGGKVVFDDLKYWHVDDPKGATMSDYYLRDGDILVNFINSMSQIGKTAIFRKILKREVIYTTNVLKLSANGELENSFLFYLTESELYKNFITLITKPAVNQASFTTKDFKTLKIPIPPLTEQQKIADILSTVDAKIDIIDQQITETQELKKGLMQRLLTKGIGHTEFKDSPLGKIPKSWEVNKLGDACVNHDNIRRPIKSIDRQKVQGIFPYYGAQGIIDYIDDFLFEGVHLLIAEDGENVKSRKNDIAIIADGKFWVNNHAHVIKNNDKSDIHFLKYYVNFMDIKPYVTGLAQPKLNKSSLENLIIPLPSIPEQQKIVNILSSIDDKLSVLSEKKTYYQELKKGLMQQLLTGKVRVNVK